MKKLFFVAVMLNLFILNSETYAQFQFASVKLNGQGLNNVMRFSWDLSYPVTKKKLSKNLLMGSFINKIGRAHV